MQKYYFMPYKILVKIAFFIVNNQTVTVLIHKEFKELKAGCS